MNNIEKFHKVKELNRLKAEYHKRELLGLISIKSYLSSPIKTSNKWMVIAQTLYNLINKIKPLIKK